jgi:hypothetical protein
LSSGCLIEAGTRTQISGGDCRRADAGAKSEPSPAGVGPGYIARRHLSKTEAGSLLGIFFAAHLLMVPILVALTGRVPVRRVYMLGTGLTALSHFGFALLADGFWSALLCSLYLLCLLAGIGWAGPICRA